MITRLRYLGLLPLIAPLFGCVNEAHAYKSPDGHIAVCNAEGAGLIPALAAKHTLDECRDTYLKAGYVEVNEPGK
jgi:hypothetical protein